MSGPRRKNLTGKKFNKLTALEFVGLISTHASRRCICECGNEIIVKAGQLISGAVTNCGCSKNIHLKQHGMAGTKFYRTWKNMKNRCYNSNVPEYKYYGLRGIKVCDEWKKFIKFRDDLYKSYLEHTKEFGEKETTLDRFPNKDGNYELSNVRRATHEEQMNNIRGVREVNQYTLDGKFIRTRESTGKAEKGVGICKGGVWKVCSGEDNRKQTGGFKRKYV